MGACEQFISHLELTLPELLSTGDLVRLGIFKTHQAAYAARHMGTGPEFFKVGQKLLYPKIGVIEFMKLCQVHNHKEKV
jgi:hypothetical protein